MTISCFHTLCCALLEAPLRDAERVLVQLRIKKGTSVIRGKQLVKVIGCNDENREPIKLGVQVRYRRRLLVFARQTLEGTGQASA